MSYRPTTTAPPTDVGYFCSAYYSVLCINHQKQFMILVLFPPSPTPVAFNAGTNSAPAETFGPIPKINTLVPKEKSTL